MWTSHPLSPFHFQKKRKLKKVPSWLRVPVFLKTSPTSTDFFSPLKYRYWSSATRLYKWPEKRLKILHNITQHVYLHTIKAMIKNPFKCESYTSELTTKLFGDASLLLTRATMSDVITVLVTSHIFAFLRTAARRSDAQTKAFFSTNTGRSNVS